MPVQILLLGICTLRRPTRLALRIRVSMSAMGSWLFIADFRFPIADLRNSLQPPSPKSIGSRQLAIGSSSPACLLQTRDLSRQRQLAEHDPTYLELPQHAAASAGQLAAQVTARRRTVARQLGQRGVVALFLELPPNLSVFLAQRFAALLLACPGFGCHACLLLFLFIRLERKPELLQQFAALFGVLGGRHQRDIHSLLECDRCAVDLG